jgi:hypothetical protein
MRSAAAMLLVLVTGYPAVSTRILSPTTEFLIFFCLSRSAAAKEIIHLSPKASIILKSLLSLWSWASGKRVMSTRDRAI